ncbi:MAG TPA: hydroxymethylbilane synthase [Candidatus Binatia bacterium]|nr:hydroxymethylbilane synthase [Candidatus Binatia bacterium]
MTALRLATRGSRLARAQADTALQALRRTGVEELQVVVVRTQGDRRPGTPVELLAGEGWFTAALEEALVDGQADIAVHSAKDLPGRLAPGLTVAAYLERGDCRDGLVSRSGAVLASLPPGATVGTSSARRTAFLAALRPDLRPVPLRGNVDSRLGRLESGAVDALLLACAGLERIGMGERITERLDPRSFVPAPCQGTIALEARDRGVPAGCCAAADHAATRAAAVAERAVLAALGGGCLLPLGAWARPEEGRLVLSAALAAPGGIRRSERVGDLDAPAPLGEQVAADLR